MKGKVGFIFLLLSQAAMASRDPEVVCSSDPVEAAVSENVILQCHLEPPLDATDMTVEWSHMNHNQVVHLHQDGKDSPAEQKDFEGRTSLSHEGLTKGNLSLKLSSVQLSDAGRYRCSFHAEKLHKSCYVNLTVAENTNNTQGKHAALRHKTTGRLHNGIIAVIVIAIVIICTVIVKVCGVKCETSDHVYGLDAVCGCLGACLALLEHL